jgi:hypothetical protein
LIDNLAAGGFEAVDPGLLEFVGDENFHSKLWALGFGHRASGSRLMLR